MNSFRYNTQQSADASLWASVADALSSIQSQVNQITGALRSPLPLAQVIQITDPSGNLVVEIGNSFGANNLSYPGIWGKNLYVGGAGPDTAPFFCDGSDVVIGKNGQVFVLDPFGNPGAWLGTQSEAPLAVSGAANNGSGLIRLNVTAHGYVSGDQVNVASVGGVPNATAQWVISVFDANHFDLLGSTFAGTYTSGGTSQRFFTGGLFGTVAVGASQRITNVADNGSGLARVTVPAHGYSTGYQVVLAGIVGVPGITGISWPITVVSANTFDLVGSVFSGAYVSGGVSLNWPTAKFIARADGSLSITNASIVVNSNGITTEISNLPSASTLWPGQASSLLSIDQATGAVAEIDPFHISLGVPAFGGTVIPVAYLSSDGVANGFLEISAISGASSGTFQFDASVATATIKTPSGLADLITIQPSLIVVGRHSSAIQVAIDKTGMTITDGTHNTELGATRIGVGLAGAPAYAVDVAGEINASTRFRVGGTAGVSASTNFGVSVNVSTGGLSYGSSLSVSTAANGVFGTPAAGQSNGTVVTGVTLNLSGATFVTGVTLITQADTFTGGLLTA